MSNKQAQQEPVARPTTEPTPKKLTAKERRIAAQSQGDTPKVAEAKAVLSRMSESLASENGGPTIVPDEPDGAEAILAHVDKTLAAGTKRCAYHKTAEPLAAFSKNITHSDGLNSSCRAAQQEQRAARVKAKAK
jgi:hypothetical protein